ncbi:Transcriptional adapter ada2 [Rhizophlyctis rosea]|nr:Transcriptional adapter ada2 [Rhizophlyctis rosea]
MEVSDPVEETGEASDIPFTPPSPLLAGPSVPVPASQLRNALIQEVASSPADDDEFSDERLTSDEQVQDTVPASFTPVPTIMVTNPSGPPSPSASPPPVPVHDYDTRRKRYSRSPSPSAVATSEPPTKRTARTSSTSTRKHEMPTPSRTPLNTRRSNNNTSISTTTSPKLENPSRPSSGRKAPPMRSPQTAPPTLSPTEKQALGYVSLDVYSLFQSNPSMLLYDRAEAAEWRKKGRVVGVEEEDGEEEDGVGRGGARKKRRRAKWTNVGRGSRAGSESVGISRGGTPTPRAGTPVDGTLSPVTWTKSVPLHIPPTSPGYDLHNPDEVAACSTLRLMPEVYLKMKDTLLTARRERGPIKKREAQKMLRVDVNKTGKIYDWFVGLGWLDVP